jgi:hypothetical protein
LAFSYWIDNLGFITEGKLAAIFIKPSLGVSNWPVILLHQQTQSSFQASSSPRHQPFNMSVPYLFLNHFFEASDKGIDNRARQSSTPEAR